MTFNEANDLAILAKGLFPMMTAAQGSVLRDLFAPFPDSAYVRSLLNRLATETTILPTPMIRAELQSELRRRGQTSEAYTRRQEKLAAAEACRQREEVEAFIADFTDDDLAEMKPKALEYLAKTGVLTADAIAFVAKINPRRSVILKNAIYELVRPQAA